MKVYQVIETDWNWHDVKGTFVYREAAEAQKNALKALHQDLHDEYWR